MILSLFAPHSANPGLPRSVPVSTSPIIDQYLPWFILAVLLALTVWAFAFRTSRATAQRDREDARILRHKRRTAWIKFARARHLQLWRSRSGPTYVLRGTREQVSVVIDLYLSDTPVRALIRARAIDPRPVAVKAWRPEVAGEVAELVRGERPSIGDARFDEAYRVKAEGNGDPLVVLDDQVRGALLAVPNVTCFEYDQGDVRLEWNPSDATTCDAAIEAVVAVCRKNGATAYR